MDVRWLVKFRQLNTPSAGHPSTPTNRTQTQRTPPALSFSAPTTSTNDTYIYFDAGPVEGGDGGIVAGHVAEELVAVLVPLDRVQAVALQIKVALELGRCRPQYVIRNAHLCQPQTLDAQDQQVTWNENGQEEKSQVW